MTSGSSENPVYEAGSGPIDVQVIDPFNLTQADFALKFYGDLYNASSTDPRSLVLDPQLSRWELVNLNNNNSYVSDIVCHFFGCGGRI